MIVGQGEGPPDRLRNAIDRRIRRDPSFVKDPEGGQNRQHYGAGQQKPGRTLQQWTFHSGTGLIGPRNRIIRMASVVSWSQEVAARLENI